MTVTSSSPYTSLQLPLSVSLLHSTSQGQVSSQNQPCPHESDANVSSSQANNSTIISSAIATANTHKNSSTHSNTLPITTANICRSVQQKHTIIHRAEDNHRKTKMHRICNKITKIKILFELAIWTFLAPADLAIDARNNPLKRDPAVKTVRSGL